MENASKALIIAGGILIGIITISIFVLMFNKIGDTMDVISTDTSEEELLKFNKSFNIYNKKVMYGSDVISAINNAIDNNERYKNSGPFVNIKFILKSDIQTVERYYNSDRSFKEEKLLGNVSFTANKEYSIKNDKDLIKATIIDALSDISSSGQASEIRVELQNGKYKLIQHAVAVFKRRIFKCNNIIYDNNSGRICEMEFIEI